MTALLSTLWRRPMQRATRFGMTCWIVVTWDLDHFKEVNDRFGHQAGGCVLKLTAEALTSELRARDMLARLGGEEFLILRPVPDVSIPQRRWHENLGCEKLRGRCLIFTAFRAIVCPSSQEKRERTQ